MIHNSSGSKAQSAQRLPLVVNANPSKIPQEPKQTFTFDHLAFRTLAQLWSDLVSPVDVFVNWKQKCNELSMSLQSLISSRAKLTELISLNRGFTLFHSAIQFPWNKGKQIPQQIRKIWQAAFKPITVWNTVEPHEFELGYFKFLIIYLHLKPFPKDLPFSHVLFATLYSSNFELLFVSPLVQRSRLHV